MNAVDLKTLEAKWRNAVRAERNSRERSAGSTEKRDRYYCLDMFPYPSPAGFSVNQLRGIVVTDVAARYQEARGKQVLRPVGWDSFGLSIETEAQARGVTPQQVVDEGIAVMREQLEAFGVRADWDREISTSDPSFYRWTQWIFLKMLERGLAYRRETPIKWCSTCRMNLANEEHLVGRCMHCNSEVEERRISQWMLRITDYAERLHKGLRDLKWPRRVKSMQRNWIGRREGYELILKAKNEFLYEYEEFSVFVRRLEWLPAVTYVVVAPEHPLLESLVDEIYRDAVLAYRERVARKTERERLASRGAPEGYPTGAYALNPLTLRQVPIWVSGFVLPDRGFGAVLGVPGHDEHHRAFAERFRLPVRTVLAKKKTARRTRRDTGGNSPPAGREDDEVMINAGSLSGLSRQETIRRIRKQLEIRDVLRPHVAYHLRDWIFARQRFWGEPIPIVYAEDGSIIPIPEECLPVTLPTDIVPTSLEASESPLHGVKAFRETTVPGTDARAQRETDTMPQWAGSCWYYLRFLSPDSTERAFEPKEGEDWLPVDLCVGGIEHAILHLLYVRFFAYFLHDLRLTKQAEPFHRLFNQGRIYRKTPTRELRRIPTHRGDRIEARPYLEEFGGDTLRLHLLFLAPPPTDVVWSESGLRGCRRFLQRCVETIRARKDTGRFVSRRVLVEKHRLIRRVTRAVDTLRLNKAVSAFMEFANFLRQPDLTPEEVDRSTLKVFAILLAPFAPRVASEVWEMLDGEGTVFEQEWPEYSTELLKPLEVEVAVFVNEKIVDRLSVEGRLPRAEILQRVRERERVQRALGDGRPARTIVVPDRLVKFVVTEKPASARVTPPPPGEIPH